jgi:hypothetical protein
LQHFEVQQVLFHESRYFTSLVIFSQSDKYNRNDPRSKVENIVEKDKKYITSIGPENTDG